MRIDAAAVSELTNSDHRKEKRKMRENNWKSATPSGWALATVLALTVVVTLSTQAQTFNVIHNFTGLQDGSEPFSLAVDMAGNLYGEAFHGGAGYGGVFQLQPSGSGWIFNTLYNFAGGNDGAGPYQGGVAIGPDGALYGVTIAGGNSGCESFFGYSGCGVVFRLQRPACSVSCSWTETVAYRFNGREDGSAPICTLAFDAQGNIYGTASSYQANGYGTVYKLSPSTQGWAFSLLYNFTGGADGGYPFVGVARDSTGNLYGTADQFGTHGYGTIYELSPSGSGWAETTLYNFGGGAGDGVYPATGLIFDQSGNLYGATQQSLPDNNGVVFQLSPSGTGWTYNPLFTLPGSGTLGPGANLTMDGAGNLYGTTEGYHGVGDFGSVFKLTPLHGSWNYTLLHQFTGGNDGAFPYSNVVLDANGNLYGTTTQGGANGDGVVWEITP